jgi:hypothetical protein
MSASFDTKYIRFPQVSSLNNNIISFWKADETNGTNLDDAVSTNDFTTNSVTWSNGMVFNANTDYANIAHTNALSNLGSAFSISFWVTLNTLPSVAGYDYSFWTQNHNADPWYYIRIFSSRFNDYIYFGLTTTGGSGNCTAATAFSAGVQYHVVVTHDGANQHIYRNATEISDDTAITGTVLNGLLETTIGNLNSWGGNQGINGTMRNIGLWSKALSQTEVTELYNSGTPKNYPF